MKPTKKDQDDFEGFARSALGKPKPAPVDTSRLKRDLARDTQDYKNLRSASVRTDNATAKQVLDREAQSAFRRSEARDDSLRKARSAVPDTSRLKRDMARDAATVARHTHSEMLQGTDRDGLHISFRENVIDEKGGEAADRLKARRDSLARSRGQQK